MVSNKWDTVNKWINDQLRLPLPVQQVQNHFFNQPNITWDVLRSDLIHPVCSGNKLFKLKYYLLDAAQKNHTMIYTEGGPWSNHIVAAAFAAKETGFAATGIITGEEPLEKSFSLKDAENSGMHLVYKGWGQKTLQDENGSAYFIPQGGYGTLGVKGAAEILATTPIHTYTHIICAVGTGTMLAGICQAAHQISVLGIPVLKHPNIHESILPFTNGCSFSLNHDYHFGGYAKKTPALLHFMNAFYASSNIPTDFVYTGKLMFAIDDLIQKNYFPEGSRILAIHSGGLQGNRSLTNNQLIF